MKALKIAVILFLLFAEFGCVHLTITDGERSDAAAAAELYKVLREINRPWEYKLGVFDCSNQSAFIYDFLQNKGYECQIIIGYVKVYGWHAWVAVKKDGRKFFVDPIFKEIVGPDYYKDYTIFYCGSLKFVKKLSKIFGLEKEYEY